jgi:hypothetical protein
MTVSPSASPATAAVAAPSLWARAVRVFVRPAAAWTGLESRAAWWFPMLLVAIVTSATMLAVYEKSYLPMMTEGIERQAADGQMTPQQLERTEAFFSGPAGRAINVGFQIVGVVILTLFTGLVVWLGGAFILGREGFGYRRALEIAAWSGLVTLPGFLLHNLLAYVRELPIREVHVGFGALLSEPETPTRMSTFLGALLDGVGPLSVWFVAVASLGLAALSGAPRKASATVMAILYLVMVVAGAGLATLSVRG